VYSANEYLTRINLMKAYCECSSTPHPEEASPVAVVGGGNVPWTRRAAPSVWAPISDHRLPPAA
jgi:hypothetical protein